MGFENRLWGNLVPIGDFTFKYVITNVPNSFVVNSAKQKIIIMRVP